jgi:hypothetical protein
MEIATGSNNAGFVGGGRVAVGGRWVGDTQKFEKFEKMAGGPGAAARAGRIKKPYTSYRHRNCSTWNMKPPPPPPKTPNGGCTTVTLVVKHTTKTLLFFTL